MNEIENKSRYNFRLSRESIDHLSNFSKAHGMTKTCAIEFMIRHHQQTENQSQEIAKELIKQLDEKYKNTITRLRLGVRETDINVQTLLGVINSVVLEEQSNGKYKDYFPSEMVLASLVKEAKAESKEKIAYYKQLKNNGREKK